MSFSLCKRYIFYKVNPPVKPSSAYFSQESCLTRRGPPFPTKTSLRLYFPYLAIKGRNQIIIFREYVAYLTTRLSKASTLLMERSVMQRALLWQDSFSEVTWMRKHFRHSSYFLVQSDKVGEWSWREGGEEKGGGVGE